MLIGFKEICKLVKAALKNTIFATQIFKEENEYYARKS
jgi:hypothetical protein